MKVCLGLYNACKAKLSSPIVPFLKLIMMITIIIIVELLLGKELLLLSTECFSTIPKALGSNP